MLQCVRQQLNHHSVINKRRHGLRKAANDDHGDDQGGERQRARYHPQHPHTQNAQHGEFNSAGGEQRGLSASAVQRLLQLLEAVASRAYSGVPNLFFATGA